MEKADVVFCRAGLTTQAERKWAQSLSLGLGYLASYARKAGISVASIDGKIEKHISVDTIITAFIKKQTHYVGLSAKTYDFPLAIAISEKVKKYPYPPGYLFSGIYY